MDNDMKVSASIRGMNEIRFSCDNPSPNYEYAFYIYRDEKDIGHYNYQKQAEISFWAQEPGLYHCKVFARDKQGGKISKISPTVKFENKREIFCSVPPPKHHFAWIHNIISVAVQIWINKKRMVRISRYRYKFLNKDAYLGSVWNILNPLIQIFTYWFVFGIGLRSGKDMDGYPYLLWMLGGVIPWFFMSRGITQGAAAIRVRGIAALKLRYPVEIMPFEEILISFYPQIIMIAILLACFVVSGYLPTLYWLNLLYYAVFELAFFTALAMITSVLSMIAIDFQKLINSLIRILFYLTPVLWSPDNMPQIVQFILKLNPCSYVVEGYRDSILYDIPFYSHGAYMAFFWGLTVILFSVGSNLLIKYKNQLMELE